MEIEQTALKLTKDEVNAIAKTFSSYKFENNEEGLYYRCKGEKGYYLNILLNTIWFGSQNRTVFDKSYSVFLTVIPEWYFKKCF